MAEKFEVILYYKYVNIPDPQAVLREQRKLCESLGLRGRILIAKEGINGTLEGTKEAIEKYEETMLKSAYFYNMPIKHSEGNGKAFPKLSIKVRDEIVTSGLGSLNETEGRITGQYLKPEELKALIESGREFYIVDMRNDYEQKSGYFEGSILSQIGNFRDLPEFIPKLSHLKHKKIVTVCTGGVRCEKASGLLKENGFSDVYQLEGGIHKYMEKYPNQDFKGKLYVFDGRVLVGFNTGDPSHVIVGRCEKCDAKSENYVNCRYDTCHRHFIVCEACDERDRGFCDLKCRMASLPIIRMIGQVGKRAGIGRARITE